MPPKPGRNRLIQFHLLVAGVMALAGAVVLWLSLSRHNGWPYWLGCWLAAINFVTFGYFGYDKARARKGQWRVPEAVLHTLTAVGGGLGAFLGMKVFRHKTIKGKFQILFWCIVVLQVLLALWIIKMVWWN